jgi:UDP-N-acetylmuramoyl-tripeptide--D-alanyl-D-alanine ligase
MKTLTFQEVVAALEGQIDRPMPFGSVARVSIDSRKIRPGDLFVAIRGERFDGHLFVGEAFEAGAMAAVVRNDYEPATPAHNGKRAGDGSADTILIRVEDTVRALGRLARYYRRSVIDGAVTVVAVTGSNGKTTTKSMIAHVLGGRWKGRAAIKSFNNAIGVPLTLLSTEPSDEFVVCEVGTNAPGEIAALARLIEPEVAVITGVAEVHLEGLGSLEGVAVEKLSLLGELRPDGCAVVNADPEVIRWSLRHDRQLRPIKKVTFGKWPQADLRLTDVRQIPGDASGRRTRLPGLSFTVNDRFVYRLKTPGVHNAFNALAAIGVARRFGMDHDEIAARLESFELPPMRLHDERLGELTLINDAYNANPSSVAAAVEVLLGTAAPGRRVFVMGDMRELGKLSEQRHRELAEHIGQSGVDLVIAVGVYARLVSRTAKAASGDRIQTHGYASTALARRRLVSHLRPNDTVLVKGSRALELERLVEAIRQWAARPEPPEPPGRSSDSLRRLKV